MLKLNRAMIAAKAAGDGLPERSTAVPLTSKGMSTKIMAPPRHRPTDEMREQRRFAAWTRMTVPPKIQKKSADNAPVGSVVRMLQAHQDQLESKYGGCQTSKQPRPKLMTDNDDISTREWFRSRFPLVVMRWNS
eukprot:GEMP01113937.1.p1 GENE.GEMP01113937.1~~GEMP01113937.1.p1  ORF type:complete len:134 (+),score=22.31 GEMP01113937.1:165-566(+)